MPLWFMSLTSSQEDDWSEPPGWPFTGHIEKACLVWRRSAMESWFIQWSCVQQEYNHRSAELCQSCFPFQSSPQYWYTCPSSECWRTDRSSHSEVAWCTLLHSYTKQNSLSLPLFCLCLFLKGEFLLHSVFFPFASSESVYNNITC